MDRWAGRVALVTGAGSGIGASVARRLVAEGMQVVGADLNVDRVQVTTQLISDNNSVQQPIVTASLTLSLPWISIVVHEKFWLRDLWITTVIHSNVDNTQWFIVFQFVWFVWLVSTSWRDWQLFIH